MRWLKDSGDANEIWVLLAIFLFLFWAVVAWTIYNLVMT